MPGNTNENQRVPKRGFESVHQQMAYFKRIASASSPSLTPEEQDALRFNRPWHSPFPARSDNPPVKDMCDAYIVELKRYSKEHFG